MNEFEKVKTFHIKTFFSKLKFNRKIENSMTTLLRESDGSQKSKISKQFYFKLFIRKVNRKAEIRSETNLKLIEVQKLLSSISIYNFIYMTKSKVM
jgi:hypothetical protein